MVPARSGPNGIGIFCRSGDDSRLSPDDHGNPTNEKASTMTISLKQFFSKNKLYTSDDLNF
jgi:hypothetical protein